MAGAALPFISGMGSSGRVLPFCAAVLYRPLFSGIRPLQAGVLSLGVPYWLPLGSSGSVFMGLAACGGASFASISACSSAICFCSAAIVSSAARFSSASFWAAASFSAFSFLAATRSASIKAGCICRMASFVCSLPSWANSLHIPCRRSSSAFALRAASRRSISRSFSMRVSSAVSSVSTAFIRSTTYFSACRQRFCSAMASWRPSLHIRSAVVRSFLQYLRASETILMPVVSSIPAIFRPR